MSANRTPATTFACRAIVLDNSEDDARHACEVLEKCFDSIGLRADIKPLTKPNELPPLLATHPDIVICDVSLGGDDDDIKGLELIENYSRKHPHIAFAAMTSNLDQLAKFDQIEVAPEFIIPKSLLFPDVDRRYRGQILAMMLQRVKQNRHLVITMQTGVESELKKAFRWQKFEKETVECLVRQVFSNNGLTEHGPIDPEAGSTLYFPSIIDHVAIKEFDKGSSGSAVFLAVPKIDGQSQEVAVVLKFCDVSNYAAEIRNYERYIKWTLPYLWRVDMLGSGRVSKQGVIGYSLAFAGSGEAKSLLYYLKQGRGDAVQAFIERAFDDKARVWYKNPRDNKTADLRPILTERLFDTGREQNRAIDRALDRIESSRVFLTWSAPQHNKRRALTNAVNRLLQSSWSPYQSCICHGDLHGGNVMVASNLKDMVFIDFQDTGIHHVFTDFVFFENAVRKDGNFAWPGLTDLIAVETGEIACALDAAHAPPLAPPPEGVRLVRNIRAAAFANFGDERRKNYFLHLLIFSLKMMSGEDIAPMQAERISAFIIGCVNVFGLVASPADPG